MSSRTLFAPLAVLFPLAAAAAPAPGGVALKFAWPSPLRCEVEHKTDVHLEGGGPPTGNTVRLSLKAVRGADGWVIRRKVIDMNVAEPPRPAGAPPAPKRHSDPRETELLLYAPFKVAKDGTFVGLDLTADDKAVIEKRQAAQDRMVDMAKKLAPSGPVMPREDLVASATKRTESSWSFLVAAWSGKDLRPGDVPELRSERDETFPFLGTMHVVDHLRVSPGVACARAPRGGCVKLEITSAPDLTSPTWPNVPDAGAAPPFAPRDVRFQLTTTLVTDPRTLIPRGVTRVVDVEMPDPDARDPKRAERKRVNVVETMTFRCQQPE